MNDVHRQVGDLMKFTPGNETAVAQKDAEIERLRKALSARLQELHEIRDQSLTWAMACNCDCPACNGLYEAIRSAEPQPENQT